MSDSLSNNDKSKQQVQMPGGALRDSEEGKIRIDFVPPEFIMAMDKTVSMSESLPPVKDFISPVHAVRSYLYDYEFLWKPEDFLWLAHLITKINNNEYVGYDPRQYDKNYTGNISDQFSAGMLIRLAKVFTVGAEYYGMDNWKKGMPLKRVLHSLTRHFEKGVASLTPGAHMELIEQKEDHFAMAVWNCCVAWWYLKNSMSVR